MPRSPFEEEYEEPEFRWLLKKGTGSKNRNVTFYESFSYDGVDYCLYDCVYMHKQGELPYIGKLVKIWGNDDASRRVKVQWFFRPLEISYYLKNVEVMENELFFASGDGDGLANVNPLEAIAGKCNVVCISTDKRNPQPSDEECQMANYVFYRTFDVKSLTVSDQFNDIVSGLQVKFVFNRKKSDRSVEAFDFRETPSLADSKQLQARQGSVLGEMQLVSSSGGALCGRSCSSTHIEALGTNDQLQVLGSKNPGCKVMGDVKDVKSPTIDDQVKGGMKYARKLGDLDDKPLKRVKSDETMTSAKDKGTNCAQNLTVPVNSSASLLTGKISSIAHIGPLVHNLNGLGKDVKSSNFVKDSADLMKATSKADGYPSTEKSIDREDAYHEKNFVGSHEDSSLSKDLCLTEEKPSKLVKLNDSSIMEDSNHRSTTKTNKSGSSEIKKSSEVKPSPSELNMRSSSEIKVPSPSEIKMPSSSEIKKPSPLVTLEDEKMKSRPPNDFSRFPKDSFKEHPNENMNKVPYGNLSKLSIAMHKDNDEKGKTIEVTPRPIAEKSTWFKELPWEERIKSSLDKGTLILLQNLDPELTSGEVEDIVYHAFNQHCAARMVQHTAISSPHNGQAFAIFKTREIAESIVKKLDHRCLMLPNKRPLVGSIAVLPKLSEKQAKFVGHLTIEKPKRQTQRDMKDAISTSHYSQTNTIEYEMSMSWCLLQLRSDRWWNNLHELQRVKLKTLKNDLKSK